MLTLKLDPKNATLADVRRKLNLSADDVDTEFGVIKIDPQKNLYAVLVDERAADKAAGQLGVQGPFSNPKIQPFGSPVRGKR